MLKNISIRGGIGQALAILALALLPNSAMASMTQIVVQWAGASGLSIWQIFTVQGVLDDHATDGNYTSDGNDVGGGKVNFYLYADDARVDAVVNQMVALETQKQLPPDMRIGVAVYKNSKRSDWDYRPVFPKPLKKFGI